MNVLKNMFLPINLIVIKDPLREDFCGFVLLMINSACSLGNKSARPQNVASPLVCQNVSSRIEGRGLK